MLLRHLLYLQMSFNSPSHNTIMITICLAEKVCALRFTSWVRLEQWQLSLKQEKCQGSHYYCVQLMYWLAKLIFFIKIAIAKCYSTICPFLYPLGHCSQYQKYFLAAISFATHRSSGEMTADQDLRCSSWEAKLIGAFIAESFARRYYCGYKCWCAWPLLVADFEKLPLVEVAQPKATFTVNIVTAPGSNEIDVIVNFAGDALIAALQYHYLGATARWPSEEKGYRRDRSVKCSARCGIQARARARSSYHQPYPFYASCSA